MVRVVIDLVDFNDYVRDNDGNRYLLNCIDSFSQFTWSFALDNREAETIHKCIVQEIFSRFGYPKILQSDNGGEFIGHTMRDALQRKGVKIIHSSPYHPETNGRVERFNRTVEGQLGKLMEELNTRRWIDLLEDVTNGYNYTRHSTTNRPPFELMFARKPSMQWYRMEELQNLTG